MTSLRDELGEADARAFTGRASELRVVDVFFDHDSAYRFLFVHGPQGIGKSALLREIARRGRGLGYDVRQQDPRAEFAPITDHPVLLIGDDVLQLAETAVDLRDRLLDTMPPGTRIVLASRERPHPAWWSGGLDALAREIRLGPLTDDDARRLVAARGVDSTLWQDEILAWAQGVPLALNVATTLESPGGARTPHLEPALEDRLAGWLSGEAIGTSEGPVAIDEKRHGRPALKQGGEPGVLLDNPRAGGRASAPPQGRPCSNGQPGAGEERKRHEQGRRRSGHASPIRAKLRAKVRQRDQDKAHRCNLASLAPHRKRGLKVWAKQRP